MLVLSLDTTTRTGSCALLRDDTVIARNASDAAQPPASRLPAELMALLDSAGVTLVDIDIFAVATGPGSFTGLRIGIATMQGLAFAGGKPLIGISALDAMARAASAGPDTRVATWVDAWRGEIYAALYENGAEVEPPVVARPEDVLADLTQRVSDPDFRAQITFIGDGAGTYRDLILQTLGNQARIADPPSPLLAGVVAQLASAPTEWLPPHAIRPLYVRRPDAELARQPKTR